MPLHVVTGPEGAEGLSLNQGVEVGGGPQAIGPLPHHSQQLSVMEQVPFGRLAVAPCFVLVF